MTSWNSIQANFDQWGIAGTRTLFILVGTWILSKVIRGMMIRFEHHLIAKAMQTDGNNLESKKRIETLVKLLRQGVNIGIWSTSFLLVLKEIGVDIRPLLTSMGVLGVAVGFGAQNLVKDLIGGFFIILENQIRVGDFVKLNGVSGLVERINLRTVILRDGQGALHYFPNGSITSLSNQTKDWSAYLFQVGVSYQANLDQVFALIRMIFEELKIDPIYSGDIMGEPEIFGVDLLDSSSVNIKGRIKTLPGKQAQIGHLFLKKIKETFEREQIEIPYPHQTIILQQGD